MKYITIIVAFAFFMVVVNISLQKTELATCQKYVKQATEQMNWYITKADYEMCKYHGIDFSEYLK